MHLTRIKTLFFVFIFTGLFSSAVIAQEEIEAQEDKSDCVIKLEQAQAKFDQGRIQDVEALITDCIAGTEFEKAEKTQALKLLTLTYLFLEEPELAEGTMLHLLETSHEFTVNQVIDPSEFINLYNKYRHDPLYSIGFLAGAVVSTPIVSQLNSTRDLNNDSRQSYSPLVGFRFALMGEYKLMDKIYANAGFAFKNIKFQKVHQLTNIYSGTSSDGFEGIESQTSIELPIIVRYHIIESRILKPYVGIGIVPQFLIKAEYPGESITNEIQGSAPATTQNIGLNDDRNRFNLNAVATVGLKFKVGEGYINGQLRYSYGIFQSSKEESALDPQDPDLLWDLTESSDGFRLHDLGISLGYTYHFYKPKKLR